MTSGTATRRRTVGNLAPPYTVKAISTSSPLLTAPASPEPSPTSFTPICSALISCPSGLSLPGERTFTSPTTRHLSSARVLLKWQPNASVTLYTFWTSRYFAPALRLLLRWLIPTPIPFSSGTSVSHTSASAPLSRWRPPKLSMAWFSRQGPSHRLSAVTTALKERCLVYHSTVALSRGKAIYRIPSPSPQPRRSTTQEGTPAAT